MAAMNMRLIYAFFDTANIHRWNDHLRPMDLTEIDKQSHKAAIAGFLGKHEEMVGKKIEWTKVIEYCLFSFMKRMVLTDLRPSLFYRMNKERFNETNIFVLEQIDRIVPDMDKDFRSRFERYLFDDHSEELENTIVEGAHYVASYWEFKRMIYDMNRNMFGIEEIKNELYKEMNRFTSLSGIRLLMKTDSRTFIDIFGQLRFQQRWNCNIRVPQTDVLGHSYMVAIMAYLHDLDVKADDRQKYNDFFAGLYHDLPELLTKDVITPIKVNVKGLNEMLDQYERELIEEKVIPLIQEEWRDEFRFLVFDPFSIKDHKVFGKVDGKSLKLCDIMGAYMEANVTIHSGIATNKMVSAEKKTKERLLREGAPINAKELIKVLDEIQT